MNKYRMRRMFRRLFVVVLMVCAGVLFWWNWATNPFSKEGKSEVITINPGMNASQIAEELEQRKMIRSAYAFRLLATQQKADSKLYAGEYLLTSNMTPAEMIAKLTSGPENALIRVTIPEGYTTAQILEEFEKKGLGKVEEYRELIEKGDFDYDFLKDIPKGKTRLDGFLFPDTYFADQNTTPEKMINMMLKRFEKEITPEVLARLEEMDFSIRDWVILASIVERETGKASDRPTIAGVFLNRLEIGMPLQSDATVAYVLGTNKYVHSLEDIKVESPYNTYIYSGLPPGPIASPGHAALESVIYPEKTNYLYFVAKKDGSSVFAETHAEQLRNQELYLEFD